MTQRPTPIRAAALALLLAAAALAAAAPAAAQNLPHGFAVLTIEPASIDFGTMERHQTRTTDLVIRNDGGADLELLDVASTCGCTVAQPEKKLLKPGQSTKLKVTFDSKEFQGEQIKYIKIRSNDPTSPAVDIPVRAVVRVPIVVQPGKLQFAFGRVRRGEVAVEKSWLQAMDGKELRLSPGSLRSDLFRVETEENVEGDPTRAILTVRLRQDAPYGPFQEVLRVGTNIPEMPSLDYEVLGEVIHDIEVHPAQLNFRYVERDRPLRHELRVRPSRSGVKFKVLRAECDLPEFKVQVDERIPGHETVVVLSGTPIPANDPRAVEAKGRIQGTVRIFTDNPNQPELQVAVTYLLRI